MNDINQTLNVSGESFKSQIKVGEKQVLQRSIMKGYLFKKLSLEHLNKIYKLISDTLTRKNYPVTMSYKDIEQTIRAMPDKYLLFGLFDNDRLIAASVSIRVSDNVLYNFYHADDISY